MVNRVKVFNVKLCFSEGEFDLEKITTKYVLDVLKRTKVITRGVFAYVYGVEISEPPQEKWWGHCEKHKLSYKTYCIFCLGEENPEIKTNQPWDKKILDTFLGKHPNGRIE